MKIHDYNINNIYELYKNSNNERQTIRKSESLDKIEISNGASKIKKSFEDYEKTRETKIQNLKEMIDKGTYYVKSEDVAKAIIKGVILDKKI